MPQHHLLNPPHVLASLIDRHPLTAASDLPLIDVIKLMSANDRTGQPEAGASDCVLIVKDDRLLGMVTDRDIVRLVAAGQVTTLLVVEAMTHPVVTLSIDGLQDIQDEWTIFNRLRQQHIRHLPIVDAQHCLIGLISFDRLCDRLQPSPEQQQHTGFEQQQAEAALRKSEATNRALLQAIPDLMIRMTGDGTYLDFIPAKDFKVLVPLQEIQGKNMFEVMPQTIATERMHYMQKALETGETQVYEYELTIDGQTHYQEGRITVSGKDEVLLIIRDITQRKRAEAALRKSEQLLRTVVNSAPIMLYAIDRNGIFTLSEGKALDALGLKPGERVGQSVFDAYPDRPDITQPIREILNGSTSYRGWILQIGTTVYESHNMPQRNQSGQVVGLIGVSTDITRRVQAEVALQTANEELELRVQERTAELRQINQQLQQEVIERQRIETVRLRLLEERQRIEVQGVLLATAIDHTADAAFWIRANGQLIYTNKAAQRSLGYSFTELAQLSIWDVETSSDEEAWAQRWQTLKQLGSLNYESYYCPQAKESFPVEISINYLEFDGDEYGFAFARDITDRKRNEVIRKQIESAIRQSEARFRRIVESNMIGIYFSNEDGQITEANDAFLALAGYSRADLYLGHMNWQSMTPLEWMAQSEKVAEELRRLGVSGTYEKEYIRKDGSRILVLVGVALMKDVTSSGYDVTFVLDITHRKLVEEQLKASLDEKDLLLREVHHRVKNNLQVISSIFSLQSQYLQDPTILSILAECQNRISSMALIHEKLYQSDRFAKIDFADYIQSLASNLFATYNVSPNLIRLNLQIADVDLNLDTAISCGLLINELVSNSLKHAFPDQRTGEVTIQLAIDSEQVKLIVQDNGIGLPPNLDSRLAPSLGLRLVRALTRQLEGKLSTSSDQGAIFQLTFAQPKARKRR